MHRRRMLGPAGHTYILAPLLDDERFAQGLGMEGMHLKPALAPAQVDIVPVVWGAHCIVNMCAYHDGGP